MHDGRDTSNDTLSPMLAAGVSVFLLIAAASADEQRHFDLVGGPSALWVYEWVDGADSTTSLRFAYLKPGQAKPSRFRLAPLGPIGGTIRLAAVRRDQLHVTFRDGSHRRISPRAPGSRVSAADPATLSIEVDLPDKEVLPLAVVGDGMGDKLWAIVGNRTALKIDESNATDVAPGDAEEVEPPPPPALSPTDFVLVRYDGNRWFTDRDVCAELEDDITEVQLTVHDGHAVIIYAVNGEPRRYFFSQSAGPDAGWTPPAPIELSEHEKPMALGFVDESPMVLISTSAEGFSRFHTMRLVDGQWNRRADLAPPDDDFAGSAGPVRGTFYESEVVLGAIGEQGYVNVGRWSADDGRIVQPIVPIGAFVPVPYGRLRTWLSQVIQFGLVAVVLLVFFLRRHDNVLVASSLEPGQTLAPLSARLAGFVIDSVILIPVFVLAYFVMGWPTTLAELQELGSPGESLPGSTGWLLLVAPGVVFALYGGAFETFLGATPGKRILGLRVVREGGSPCRLRGAALRNLLRLVDFQFPPVLLLVLMTLHRQRLGDIVAGTVVVCDSAEPQATDEVEEPADDEDDGDVDEAESNENSD